MKKRTLLLLVLIWGTAAWATKPEFEQLIPPQRAKPGVERVPVIRGEIVNQEFEQFAGDALGRFELQDHISFEIGAGQLDFRP